MLIDVWNPETYDEELLLALRSSESLIMSYFIESRRIDMERENSDHRSVYRSNSLGHEFNGFLEVLISSMKMRTIRAWHYTRLTDEEVDRILKNGLLLSNIGSLSYRLSRVIKAGKLTKEQGEAIYNASPIHNAEQGFGRVGAFWATSHPYSMDNPGIELLIRYWGGEVSYFWQKDEEILSQLEKIGEPRIIEIAVPLEATSAGFSAASSVISTFSEYSGVTGEFSEFDICIRRRLGSDAVLAVHTQGDSLFERIGRNGYAPPRWGTLNSTSPDPAP